MIVAETNMVAAVLLHCDGALKGTVSDSKSDPIGGSFLDDLWGLVWAIACDNLTIDLWETERERGRKERGKSNQPVPM